MGVWNERRITELERELRAQRPRPSAALMQRLGGSRPATRPRRSLLPKFALVGAVTVVLAASLGAAGAVGYATKSVQTFGNSVFHIVSPPSHKSDGPSFSNSSNQGDKGNKNNNNDNGNNGKGNDGKGGNGGGGNGGGGNGGGGNGGGGNGGGGDGDNHGHDPFHHEYDHQVPICHGGHNIYVPSNEYFYRLLHGDRAAPCPPEHKGR